MNEYLALLIVDIIFLLLSWLFRRLIIGTRQNLLAIVLAAFYFIAFYEYFEVVNKAQQFLRDRQFYIEWGHASLLLIVNIFPCFIFAVIFIFFTFITRSEKRRQSHN